MDTASRGEIKQRLQQIDPYEFEELVAEIWELEGYETTVRKGSGDRGVDIEASKEAPFEQKILIQAKRYGDSNKVGSKEVRNYATLYQQVPNADNVLIVTTSDFTTEAESLARDLNLKIINNESLIDLIIDWEDELSITNKIPEELSQKQSVNNELPDSSKNIPNFTIDSQRKDRDWERTHRRKNSAPTADSNRQNLKDKVRNKINKEGNFAINWGSEDRTHTCKIIFSSDNCVTLEVDGVNYEKIKKAKMAYASGTFQKDNGDVTIYMTKRTSKHALTVVKSLITMTDSHFEDIFRFD